MRWAVCAGIATLPAILPGRAAADQAEVGGVEIELEAPASCPDAAEVAARLETAVEGAALTPTSVHIRVAKTGAVFELELVIGEDRERRRRLRGEWCGAAIDAAVLVLSLALLPDSPTSADDAGDLPPADQIRDVEEPMVPPPPPPAPAGFEEDPPEVVAEAGPGSVPISMSIGAAAAIDGGTLPGLAPGVGIAMTARRAGLTLDLAATYFPTHTAVIDREMNQGGAINATAINLRGCRATAVVWLCVGGEMSVLGGSGVGLGAPEETRFFLWGFTGAARYQRALGDRLVMAATAEIVGHPARPSYFIDNPRRLVHQPGWLSARLWLVGQVVIF